MKSNNQCFIILNTSKNSLEPIFFILSFLSGLIFFNLQSTAQVALRWAIQLGIIVIPKSVSEGQINLHKLFTLKKYSIPNDIFLNNSSKIQKRHEIVKIYHHLEIIHFLRRILILKFFFSNLIFGKVYIAKNFNLKSKMIKIFSERIQQNANLLDFNDWRRNEGNRGFGSGNFFISKKGQIFLISDLAHCVSLKERHGDHPHYPFHEEY